MKSDLERPTSFKSQFHHMVQQWASLQAALEAPWKRLRQRRVALVRQLSPFECGAACLTMILNYYGRQVDIAECRAACGVGRDGLTALTITKAARAEGLHVRTFTLDPCDLSRIPLPAIVHWNFNHFVVLERWTPESTLVVDPAVGRRRISAKEFDQSFTGVVLTFEPGPGFQRREARLRSWHLYLRYALRTPGVSRFLIQVLLASLLLTLLGLAVPIFTKILVDHLLPFHLTDITAILGIGVCIAGFAQFATAYIRATLLVYLRTRFDTHLMLSV